MQGRLVNFVYVEAGVENVQRFLDLAPLETSLVRFLYIAGQTPSRLTKSNEDFLGLCGNTWESVRFLRLCSRDRLDKDYI